MERLRLEDNDRNLAGRFSTRTFSLTRLSAVQNYFLRQYDASAPPKYSRYTTTLHLNSVMKDREDDISGTYPYHGGAGRQALVVRADCDFQGQVLEKLVRLEAKMDMLVGSGQPGRMKLAEDRLVLLEKSEIRRGVYDRIVNAAITVAISAAIAMHDRWGIK